MLLTSALLFRELLSELGDISLDAAWKDVKKDLKDDPRYTKFSSSDKKCEREFRDYLKDRLVAAKAEYRELLKVCNRYIYYFLYFH